MHYIIKQFVPPIFKTLYWYSFKYGWKGDYESFAAANKIASGYNEQHILEKIKETTLKVVSGEVAYERDGIVYDKPIMNFSMLATLLNVAAENSFNLTVLDFDGSLGTTYNHMQNYLNSVHNLHWCIVEQSNYVEAGRKEFEHERLHFYYSLEECLQHHKPDIAIFSGVIQYIEKTYELLDQIALSGVKYLYIDYIAFNDEDYDRIAIQYVPPVYYGSPASYTCWFYSKLKFYKFLQERYDLVYDFIVDHDKYYIQFKPFLYEGQLWKLKSSAVHPS